MKRTISALAVIGALVIACSCGGGGSQQGTQQQPPPPPPSQGSYQVAWLQEVSGNPFVFTPMLGAYNNSGQFTSRAYPTQNMYESVALSPDGKKIAWMTDGIWTANVDGSNPTHIQSDGADPQWSPDGTKITYVPLAGGIWMMNADGSNQRQILGSYDYWYVGDPKFSTDGSRIAAAVNNGIATFDTSGGSFKQLTTGGYIDPYGSNYYDIFPAYTKGGHIMFSRFMTLCDYYWCYDPYIDIMIMNADGSGVRSVVGGISSDMIYVEPTPISNGKVLFASNVDNPHTSNLDLYAFTFSKSDESDTPTVTRLTTNTLFDSFYFYLYGTSGWAPVGELLKEKAKEHPAHQR